MLVLLVGLTGAGTSQDGAIRVQRRDIVVAESAEDGSRFVVDVLTLVREDSGVARWSVSVPGSVIGLTVADGNVPPEAVRHVADRIEVSAVLRSGRSRLVLHYVLPPAARAWELVLREPTDTLAVLAQDGDVVPKGVPFAAEGVFGLGPAMRAHVATAVPPGTRVQFVAPRGRGAPRGAWWIVVVAAATALAGGFGWWARRTGALARRGLTP